MINIMPGTTIETTLSKGAADRIFNPLFLGGGLVLSQVTQLTSLEGYIVQNWIKRGFMTPPKNKKYTRKQFCRILNINILKDSFTFDQAVSLLGYINGALDNEDDDLIDDSLLYSYFIDTISKADEIGLLAVTETGLGSIIKNVTKDFKSDVEFAKKRLEKILLIMVMAYISTLIKKQALTLFGSLDYK